MEDVATPAKAPDRVPIRAAEYVRMSTDHQKYSTENQSEANRLYAEFRRMEIIRRYVDEGKSGLTFERRRSLQRLISDVQSGTADFKVILVYDVSRWGRPQDPDEAAYYEFMCKRAGIAVHYCAEPFENDGSALATLSKNMKRWMAGEFSRDLSIKVFAGQSRLVRLGYRTGGSAPFGLRRLLVDQGGTPKGYLAYGERKSIQTDRIVLVPGEPKTIEIVRWIFDAFANRGKQETEIARELNRDGILSARGTLWADHHVRTVLTNENYIGNLVWNRQSLKLKAGLVRNPPSQWIRASGVIAPIVDRKLFERAEAIRIKRAARLSREQRLEALRRIFRKHGTLSIALIEKAPNAPSVHSYAHWFGSLRNAYRLVGFNKYGLLCKDGRQRRSSIKMTLRMSNDEMVDALKSLLEKNGYLSRDMVAAAANIPCPNTYGRRFGSLTRAFRLAGLTEDRQRRPNRPQRSHDAITRALSDQELLGVLRKLFEASGVLSEAVINQAKGVPCVETYRRRFGSLMQAYQLIGYEPTITGKRYSSTELLNLLRKCWSENGRISGRLLTRAEGFPAAATYQSRFGSLQRAYKKIGYRAQKNQFRQ